MHINTDSSDGSIAWVTTDTASAVSGVLSTQEEGQSMAIVLPTLWKELVGAMHSLGMPMLIFGGTFVGLMLVLGALFSPDRFPVRVGDKTVKLAQLLSEKASIETAKAELLSDGAEAERAVPTPVITQVRSFKASQPSLGSALSDAVTVLQSFNVGSKPIVNLQHVRLDGTSILLMGEVTDPDGRSIPLLASIVDALRKRRSIASVAEPEYQQTLRDDGSSISPFTIRLTPAHAE